MTTHEEHAHPQLGFVRKYIFSTDHKIIGVQYIITAMAMAVVGGILSMLMRLQLGWPSAPSPMLEGIFPTGFAGGIMAPEFYLSLVTMHGTIMVFFLFTAVLTGGFGNFLIPLQIGARDMAFPFLNALSYWTFLLSCITILGALFVEGGAPLGGWTAYAPLSALPEMGPGQGDGMTLWIVAIALFTASGLMGGLNYVTTLLTMRTKGMSMMRLPLTQWALFITAILGTLAFPVLLAAGILLTFDRIGGTSFFVPAGLFTAAGVPVEHSGGHPLLWQHLFWFFGHPEVYIVLLPAMGIASDILSTFARKPIFSYRMMVYSMSAIAFLSFIVWGHHMFLSGMNPILGSLFTITTLLIAIPSAVKTFNWIGTVWGARIRFTVPMLFALGFVSTFISGGLSGVFLGTSASDIALHDTYFVVGHFHLVMAVAPLFAAFAGIYFWFPKMFGRMMNMTVGKVHFWISFIGVNCVFFPMHAMGVVGHLRRIYDPTQYVFMEPVYGMNQFVSIAAFVLGAAQILFIGNFFASIWFGPKAGTNPWNATTLEWTVPSPPGHGNFGPELPVVERWGFDYGLPGAKEDFVMQTEAPSKVESGSG